jgi:hypothetical protein
MKTFLIGWGTVNVEGMVTPWGMGLACLCFCLKMIKNFLWNLLSLAYWHGPVGPIFYSLCSYNCTVGP